MRIGLCSTPLALAVLLVACGESREVADVGDCVELWHDIAEQDPLADVQAESTFEVDRIEVEYSERDGDNDQSYCIAYYFVAGSRTHFSVTFGDAEVWTTASYVGDSPAGAVQVNR